MSTERAALPMRLGRYEVRAKIADGGMAAVYVAREDGGAVVALKMIRDEFARNKEFLTMFTDEAKIVARLRHPNVVRYHELANENGHVFLVMELLVGQSLWSVWEACRARGLRLRYDMIAWIGARVAEGLHYAHELVDEHGRPLDIVHRDVNATNVFVTYDGDVKIIDFGLAKAANRASKTAAGIIKGKVAYMSPEQAVGAPVDRRTDVFALGTTLWELACDRRLFKHSDEVETLKRVHAADVPDPTRLVEGFPPALWRILQRALARDKVLRYPTAAELVRDLDDFARGQGPGVEARTVADVMRELFADERSRQEKWIADASGPERVGAPLETLRPPSSFWTAADTVDAAPSAVAAPPAIPSALARPRPLWPVLTGAILVIAALTALALALR
jgi:serine/threonine-protein kinase